MTNDRNWSKIGAVIGVVSVVVAIVLGIGVPGIVNSNNDESKTLFIDSKHHHLGDVYSEYFDPPTPEGNTYSTSFDLDAIPNNALLSITTKHVDPVETKASTSVIINNYHIAYLNDFVHDENLKPKKITFNVPVNTLREGTNLLEITVNELRYEDDDGYFYFNTDDIEFWDIKITLND